MGIIPHYSEYDYFYEKYGNRYHVINLATSDVIRVTKDITSCEYILSTSLHGLVVPHAYNIPALWIEHRELQPDSDGYKFKDYFSSVGITQKKPFRDIDNILKDYDAIDNLFKKMKEYTLPQVNVDTICKNLLKAAPFPLKEKYREFTK